MILLARMGLQYTKDGGLGFAISRRRLFGRCVSINQSKMGVRSRSMSVGSGGMIYSDDDLVVLFLWWIRRLYRGQGARMSPVQMGTQSFSATI